MGGAGLAPGDGGRAAGVVDRRWLPCVWAVLIALSAVSCGAPVLSQDGQLVFSEGGARGASVLTANGVQFIDRSERPAPHRPSSAFEAWSPPTGFLLPVNGVLTKRAQPLSVSGRGVSFVVRTSDVYAPTWGGEILIRVDVVVPVQAFPELRSAVRAPVELVLVVDFANSEGLELVYAALESLGTRDRVLVLDARRGHRLVPLLPGTHRALIAGAVEQSLRDQAERPRALGRALSLARAQLSHSSARHRPSQPRVLVISDGIGFSSRSREEPRALLEGLAASIGDERVMLLGSTPHASLPQPSGVAVRNGSELERAEALYAWLPPPGPIVLEDVVLELDSAPAPLRILEASGAEVEWGLEQDALPLGDFSLGESRTEVLRVSVPEWVDGQPLLLRFRARYRALGQAGGSKSSLNLGLRYSEDIELLANARHGDVIAYASALAMVRRLERVFQGSSIDRLGGLSGLVEWQARGLSQMARRFRDPSLAEQAEVLRTLLRATH